MTVTLWQLTLYTGGMTVLWAIPGPVWVAIIARTMAGGFAAAWPLAIGVALGDLFWPMAAIFGLNWILSLYGNFLHVLRIIAAVTFIIMGILLIRKTTGTLTPDSRLTRPGKLAGFLTGVAVVTGNPKAILFISMLIPILSNLALALFLDRARQLLQSPENLRRINLFSGALLILVGGVIVLT